ncbi:MAG: hypothetical protein IPK64_13850 [bacterium]|nr:hypothetical protein [bacterium]
MAGKPRKWLLGCGLGCGGLILLSIGGPIVLGLFLMPPLDRAIDAQKELVAALGAPDDHVPPAGPVAADRLDAFLAVRRAVMPHCAAFEEFTRDLGRMDELGSQSDQPPGREIFRAVTSVTGSILGLVGDIGKLNEARNRALLEQKMGLGEYTWIYVLAYHSWLGHPIPDRADGDDGEGDGARVERLRTTVLGLMRRHAAALEEVGDGAAAGLWRDEADRMEGAAAEVPFGPGGLPPDYTAAFAARGDELRATWCAPMAEYDLGEVRRSGLTVHAQ